VLVTRSADIKLANNMTSRSGGPHCAKKKCALPNIFGSVAGITRYDGKGSPIIFTEYSRFAKL
jgi:hypothetical protein